MRLITSDEYPAHAEAIRDAYGARVRPPRTGRRGRPRAAYTTVHKERENGRVVFGTGSR